MKITKEELKKSIQILKKMEFGISDMALFFPLEIDLKDLNEYGITTSSYKNETHYGSTLIVGLSVSSNEEDICLSYISTVDLFSFNLKEYFSIIECNLTKEELDYIGKFEVGIAHKNKFNNSLIKIKSIFF